MIKSGRILFSGQIEDIKTRHRNASLDEIFLSAIAEGTP
jgi:hypothetical protein